LLKAGSFQAVGYVVTDMADGLRAIEQTAMEVVQSGSKKLL
jgi:hypothetical protein